MHPFTDPLFASPPPDVLEALMEELGAKAWTTLVWDMHHTARSGLSFALFQNIFQLLGIRSGVYQLDYETLLDINPLPCLLYADALQGFGLLKKIGPEAMTFQGAGEETMVIDRAVMEPSWDGKILAMGAIPQHYAIQKAVRTGGETMPDRAETMLLEVTTDEVANGSRYPAGQWAPDRLHAFHRAGFECLVPGPFRELTLHVSARFADGVAQPVLKVRLPLTFSGRHSILRFFFSGMASVPEMIGVKGSVQGLFHIELPQKPEDLE